MKRELTPDDIANILDGSKVFFTSGSAMDALLKKGRYSVLMKSFRKEDVKITIERLAG